MTALHQPIHVFVVAPVMLCWGFERLVNTACPAIRMTGSAPSLQAALAGTHRALVDVLVVDYDEGAGSEALRLAAEKYPVLLLTPGEPQGTLAQLRATGVEGAVSKRDDPSTIVHAIQELKSRRGRRPGAFPTFARSPGTDRRDVEQARIESLTVRERQLILVLMCNSSASGKVLADLLCISEHTLRNHLTSIYAKLGVHSRLGLHAYAKNHRLEHTLELTAPDVGLEFGSSVPLDRPGRSAAHA